ncbi:putative GPI transamidase component [Taphrina deformans PYCC 5710]|uniref:GPI transamidase component n=1 Tax=Taphrina deformans (strain PYCC 5710 / ATCC 11124 / CBS 356.35 / IMI 108563 / JCM 9778 / NBRC 8474) TaxID=1097556 RepID=R4XBJ4_TAPDE|nr:putative GPI transamidase component [Taphrina deformans PYCC 5710]|eukprot:CCG80708.1 putative GPI transamidase component [Taphrina deformans PYCC 5710]
MGLLNYFFTFEGRRKLFTFLVRRVTWLSTALFFIGICWLLALPKDEFNIPTRISENALLPGQVQTHFGGSDYKVLNAFRNEIRLWQQLDDLQRVEGVQSIFRNAGMKSARQHYNVSLGSRQYAGINVYGLLEAPRGDATEALVINAAWKNAKGVVNEGGVAQLLALARYFRRWSVWSKDILFVIPGDREFGSQAWIDAYHENQDTNNIEPLTLVSGVIQAGIDIDWYGEANRYNHINVKYEGSNGQLANLDLVNSAIHIAKHQLGIMPYVQNVFHETYPARLLTMFRALASQAHGLPTGSHSPYIPYKIDTISIEIVGNEHGYHDDSSLGRIIESIMRSLNNILEHLHASFFFYILITTHRFISIGTYLPSAMLISICFTITGLSLYLKITNKAIAKTKEAVAEQGVIKDTGPTADEKKVIEVRSFSFSRTLRPAAIVTIAHLIGLTLFYVLRLAVRVNSLNVLTTFLLFEYCISFVGPSLLAARLNRDDIALLNSFSQLVLGMFLSAIATINFSLALSIGVMSFPYSFIGPVHNKVQQIPIRVALLVLTSPMSILYLFCTFTGIDWRDVVVDVVFGYEWLHVWTPLAIFGVWWPAYFLTSVVVSG